MNPCRAYRPLGIEHRDDFLDHLKFRVEKYNRDLKDAISIRRQSGGLDINDSQIRYQLILAFI